MSFRSQFRAAEDWIETTNGCMILNTASNEAAKCYDATINQLLGYYQESSLGGPAGTCKRMLGSDPNFILGRALEMEMKLIGPISSLYNDQRIAKLLEDLNAQVADDPEKYTLLENFHVEAVNKLAHNKLKEATVVLEKLVSWFPDDVWALKLLQHTYIKLGYYHAAQNSLAYAVPKISANNPFKGYAHGLYAFALEETNQFARAQSEAQLAMNLNPNDTWAIHAYAHCFEMQGQPEEGLKWLEEQEPNWVPCTTLASHQYWHKALFYINNEQFDEAVFVLDTELMPRCKDSPIPQNWISASSLLYRMELINLIGQVRSNRDDVPERWSVIYDMCKPRARDHLWGFYDANYLMSYLAVDALDEAEEFIKSIDEESCTLNEGKTVVKPLLQAMLDFKLNRYELCAESLFSLRNSIPLIGGSGVQRDVFNQLLIVAAKKSPDPVHNELANRLILERDGHLTRRLPLQDHLSLV